jgi:hypothetical protein
MGPLRRPLSSGSAGRPTPPKEGKAEGSLTLRQAIIVAVITAAATILAAVINYVKPADQPHTSPNIPSSAIQAPGPRVHLRGTSFGQTSNSRFIVAKGYVDGLLSDRDLFVIATPANGEPAQSTQSSSAGVNNQASTPPPVHRWYVSDPVAIQRDGSWEARIEIDPTETRVLTVQAVLASICDVPKYELGCGGFAGNGNFLGPGTPTPSPSRAPTDPSFILEITQWLKTDGPATRETKSDPTTIPVPHR